MMLYGEEEVVFNVHSWLHVGADVRIHGPLDNFSAFPFESYMQIIRSCVTSRHMIAEQVFRRTQERCAEANLYTDVRFWDNTFSGPVRSRGLNGQLMDIGSTIYSNETPNNCALINRRPAVIQRVEGALLHAHLFEHCDEFFDYPIPSGHLGVFLCHSLSESTVCYGLSEVMCKGLLLPYGEKWVFYPILHTWANIIGNSTKVFCIYSISDVCRCGVLS
ncbi:hypothetical protein FGIG_04193 [Fasciola gigantica]|uniref:Uncharacterized protein n=1 Tax=Fasciola gigantica TaxID=46835 RepID=A0A504YUP5_FASGI|nr:hypothetical protein FGIG_04193 [Fasciola gigantica]